MKNNPSAIRKIIAVSISVAAVFLFPLCAWTKDKAYETQNETIEILKINENIIPFQNGIPLPSFEPQKRDTIGLNGVWKKMRFNADHRLSLKKRTKETISELEKETLRFNTAEFDDFAWKEHKVPGVENPAPDRYQDGVLYRKTFKVSGKYRENELRIMFGAVNYVCDVWINGIWVGMHEGGYTPFAFNITEYIKFGSDNLICLRVDNIPWLKKDDSTDASNSRNIVPFATCDWWNHTGILRGISIEILPKISVVRADVKSFIKDGEHADVIVNTVIQKTALDKRKVSAGIKVYEARIDESNILSLYASDIADFSKEVPLGGTVNCEVQWDKTGVGSVQFNLRINNPKLWSSEHPNLYVLELLLKNNEKEVEKYYSQFGIREVKTDRKSGALLINNEKVFLRGVGRTEVIEGEKEMTTSYNNFVKRDLDIIKNMNADFIRTGHWPNDRFMYVLTDRLGICVWEEIPVYWFNGPEFNIQRLDRKIAWQMFLEMIYRDYNRPSILFWGTTNESGWTKERALFIRSLYQSAYMIDGTRLVAQSAYGEDPKDETQSECDVLGFTMYNGVFYGRSAYEDTKNALELMTEKNPGKPIIATEYGIWSETDQSNASKQSEIANDTFRAFKEHSSIAGACWWAMFDWHTMISEPQTMGLMKWGRKYNKPVYYDVQKNYGDFTGFWDIKIASPEKRVVSGKFRLQVDIPENQKAEFVEYSIDNEKHFMIPAIKSGEHSLFVNSKKLSEGTHIIYVRAKNESGRFSGAQKEIFVDNKDDRPEIDVMSLLPGHTVMGRYRIRINAFDDRGIEDLKVKINNTASFTVEKNSNGKYEFLWDTLRYGENFMKNTLRIDALDTGGNAAEKKIDVYIDNAPGMYVDIPFNHDWIASLNETGDGTGYDFPAELMPESGSEFIYNSKSGPVKFKLGKTGSLERNNHECRGGTLQVRPGNYKNVYMVAVRHNESGEVPFTFFYTDGTKERKFCGISDWWSKAPGFDEEVIFRFPYHIENTGAVKPGVFMYFINIKTDENRVLKSIGVPNDEKVHIFAATLNGKPAEKLHPDVDILFPHGNQVISGIINPKVVFSEKNLPDVKYLIDSVPVSSSEIDTSVFADGPHIFKVMAYDHNGQIGSDSVQIVISNKHKIISPQESDRVYKSKEITVEARIQSNIEYIAYSIDRGPEIMLKKQQGNIYGALWMVPDKFKEGSRHKVNIIIKEKGEEPLKKEIEIYVSEPLRGHSIKVDKNISDWKGKPPKKNDSWHISEGEFIWKDAISDDVGPGSYTYPLNTAFSGCADITEVRITNDRRYLYILIKAKKPGDWWASYRIIGIHKEGSSEKSTTVLAQGNPDKFGPDEGCFGEIMVAEELACQYIIGISGTYKGRIWNAEGELVAKKDGQSADTPGFKIDDDNWENVEIAVPLSIVGKPFGQTWRFIVGMGVQENDCLREVSEKPDEWHGGGGEGIYENIQGPDPDIYDLVGSTPDKQIEDLTFTSEGANSKYAVIKHSFISVTFAE